MSYSWIGNGLGMWGFDTGGGPGDFLSLGPKTPISGIFTLCRPPGGTGHFLWYAILFYDVDGNPVQYTDPVDSSVHTEVDLFDPDYIGVVGSSGDIDVRGSITSPPGATQYILAVLDGGPYDGTGTTLGDYTTYSPYASADDAFAATTACGAASPALSGVLLTSEVHFS